MRDPSPVPSPPCRGLTAFPLTPADADGIVNDGAYADLIDRLARAGVDRIGALGSTGIGPYLEGAQRRRAVAAAIEAASGRVPVMVNVSVLRTDHAVMLARDAAALGADALLLAPMSYVPLTEDEIVAHYATVAAATDLPVCIYNNPTTTHAILSAPLLARLSNLPGVAAVKMPLPSDGDFAGEIARLRGLCAPGFAIGYSADWGMTPAFMAGADHFHSVIGGLLPEPTRALARAAQDGDMMESARLEAGFAPLWALFRQYGSLRVVYAMASRMGLDVGAPPPPLRAVPEETIESVLAALTS